jgi:hypothetical protein
MLSREQGIIIAESGLGHNAAVLLGSGSARPSEASERSLSPTEREGKADYRAEVDGLVRGAVRAH